MARATAPVMSLWKFFHVFNQFPRPARKNGHLVLFAILEQGSFVKYINTLFVSKYRCVKHTNDLDRRSTPRVPHLKHWENMNCIASTV
jgi:hypothetical protein